MPAFAFIGWLRLSAPP